MSKVVHLNDSAHATAKEYCKDNGLKMSDWVAKLILEAIDAGQPRSVAPPPTEARRKKPLKRLDEHPEADGEGVPVYSAPPFWARK